MHLNLIFCLNVTAAEYDTAGIFGPFSFLRSESPARTALRNFSTHQMRLAPTSVFTTQSAPTALYPAWRDPTIIPRRGSTKEPTKPSDVVIVGVKLVFIVIGGAQVSKVDLVSQ